MGTTIFQGIDWKLIVAAFLLSVFGIILIFSAQYYTGDAGSQAHYIKQMIWLGAALIGFMITISLPPRFYDFASYLFYILIFILLLAVLFFGSRQGGAASWFKLGPINLQPSEFAKIAVLMALSRFFAYTKKMEGSFWWVVIPAIIVALPVGLILRQPDLGTALVFFVLLFSLWFFGGLSPLKLALIVSPLVSMVAASHWIAWVIYFIFLLMMLYIERPGRLFTLFAMLSNLLFGMLTPVVWNRLAEYQKLRILIFLDPGRDPQGAGYQIIQAIISIGSGGLLGKGFLDGSQTRLEYLPVRHTDFVFSVLGEELGFLGGLAVITLFGVVVYRGLKIAARCRSKYMALVSWGAVTIIFFQMVVNIGMTLGLMPVTGLPLPFVSYGGTSWVMYWLLIGLLVLANRHWQEY